MPAEDSLDAAPPRSRTLSLLPIQRAVLATEASDRWLRLAERLTGPLDERALAAAVGVLARRHEALRVAFTPSEEVQVLHESAPLRFPILRANGPGLVTEPLRSDVEADLAGLEPSRPPRLGGGLVRLGDEEHVLFLCLDRLVGDRRSLALLSRELRMLYGVLSGESATGLPPAPSYAAHVGAAAPAATSTPPPASGPFQRSRLVVDRPDGEPAPFLRLVRIAAAAAALRATGARSLVLSTLLEDFSDEHADLVAPLARPIEHAVGEARARALRELVDTVVPELVASAEGFGRDSVRVAVETVERPNAPRFAPDVGLEAIPLRTVESHHDPAAALSVVVTDVGHELWLDVRHAAIIGPPQLGPRLAAATAAVLRRVATPPGRIREPDPLADLD